MYDVARRITYLDTLELLAKEVKLFDGRSHGRNNGFWDAIQHSSIPGQAVRLMSARILARCVGMAGKLGPTNRGGLVRLRAARPQRITRKLLKNSACMSGYPEAVSIKKTRLCSMRV
jgi:hypothetical protein